MLGRKADRASSPIVPAIADGAAMMVGDMAIGGTATGAVAVATGAPSTGGTGGGNHHLRAVAAIADTPTLGMADRVRGNHAGLT
ncbi:hypothetical protein A5686_02350 [Mycobacterium sp. E2479]|nr:hypothetical protein A5686_02350 [Mycobacterium sp. E2479]